MEKLCFPKDKEKMLLTLMSPEVGGNITVACKKRHISRMTFCRWRNKDKLFDDYVSLAIEEGKNTAVELVENSLFQQAMDGKPKATELWLQANKPNVYGKKALSGEFKIMDYDTYYAEKNKKASQFFIENPKALLTILKSQLAALSMEDLKKMEEFIKSLHKNTAS